MLKRFIILFSAAAVLGGCASSQMKARKEQRDRAAQSSGLYCDFVNGELYPDVEVMVNLEMAKRCDKDKAFSLTNYKTSNENMGIVFCCAIRGENDSKDEKDDKEQKSSARSEAAPSRSQVAPAAAAAAAAQAVRRAAAPAAKPAAPQQQSKAPEKSNTPEPAVDELGD
jgi:hypothetical protein